MNKDIIFNCFVTELIIAIAHEVVWHEGNWWAKGYNREQMTEIFEDFSRRVNHKLYA